MASKKTVTLDNLITLGPERLAAILVELANGDAEVKRRLRLELASQTGGGSIAAEIGKRLTALRSARSFIDCTHPARAAVAERGGVGGIHRF